MKDLYVVNCCRTAIGSFGGSLKNTPAAEMGAVVVKEALKRANVAPENVDELMFGCILTAAQGQNVARQVSIKAGIPYSVPAYTVGMVCGSGMKSVIEGARSILAGDSDIVVCGGTENMSAAPFASMDARWGARMGDKKLVDTMIKDGLWDAYNNYHMGTTAENINDIWGITRAEQDAFAADIYKNIWHAMDHSDNTNAVSAAACTMAEQTYAQAIIADTSTGKAARRVAKYRPAQMILAATPSEKVYHQLALVWGVYPLRTQPVDSVDVLFHCAIEKAKELGYLHSGDTVVMTAGIPLNTHGSTNMVKVQTIR